MGFPFNSNGPLKTEKKIKKKIKESDGILESQFPNITHSHSFLIWK